MFQSSPNPKVGRYPVQGVALKHPEGVSILAQPEGRALRRRRPLFRCRG